jgi:hypothetical protein
MQVVPKRRREQFRENTSALRRGGSGDGGNPPYSLQDYLSDIATIEREQNLEEFRKRCMCDPKEAKPR